jgi:hypothetical protein
MLEVRPAALEFAGGRWVIDLPPQHQAHPHYGAQSGTDAHPGGAVGLTRTALACIIPVQRAGGRTTSTVVTRTSAHPSLPATVPVALVVDWAGQLRGATAQLVVRMGISAAPADGVATDGNLRGRTCAAARLIFTAAGCASLVILCAACFGTGARAAVDHATTAVIPLAAVAADLFACLRWTAVVGRGSPASPHTRPGHAAAVLTALRTGTTVTGQDVAAVVGDLTARQIPAIDQVIQAGLAARSAGLGDGVAVGILRAASGAGLGRRVV